ncbi:MAG: anthranilate synthase component I family protein [Bacteroidales bacterium]|nr:anthranilate synthase component I family protein [Bacteroidales bacterium]
MEKIKIKTESKTILADIITPVSIYLKVRDVFPGALLLESSDYHSNQNSFSFICLRPLADFEVINDNLVVQLPGYGKHEQKITNRREVVEKLDEFVHTFQPERQKSDLVIDGIFGYSAYDSVMYFEDIKLEAGIDSEEQIPDIKYGFYKYIIAINHLKNELQIIENLVDGEKSELQYIGDLIQNRNIATYHFKTVGGEQTNMTDEQYMEIVDRGKEHCYRGDVFQIVLSRQFSQGFRGDDFNVYRSLRSINPSPYLFYFDYGSFRLFGSSPETQIEVSGGKAYINPIAGTFRRTGNDDDDQELAKRLADDEKENAEHIMLVDLARNDLSRTTSRVTVEKYREIQFYSHVIHMVSKVSGQLKPGANTIEIMAESFPAGTLSGAPKYRAMELIDAYEGKRRGFYGGTIGNIRLNGDINHAIMIRSFMSKNNRLFYQAGAGIVSESKRESELKEVKNKLAALTSAIQMAQHI